jgi:dTDP-4-amino-4,6-dideoxygalactose transaminase
MQAAFLRVKLRKIDEETVQRKKIAETYLKEINNETIKLPTILTSSSWHLFVILTKDRDRLEKHLKNKKIDSLIHYPVPPHKQKAFLKLSKKQFRISENIHNQIISLPISGVQTEEETEKIISAVNSFR